MSQSTVLIGALAAAFIVFLAMNNRLSVYWSFLTGTAAGGSGSATTTSSPVTGTVASPSFTTPSVAGGSWSSYAPGTAATTPGAAGSWSSYQP